jgi:ABC-type nickel/cobalt efflux system permease component RcnA
MEFGSLHTHAHTHAHTRTHSRTPAHTHAHTHTRTHAHTHAHKIKTTRLRALGGNPFVNIFKFLIILC